MIDLLLDRSRSAILRVLCIGAHCDDIEIGCGGTLLEWQRHQAAVTFDWVILSGTAERRDEARRARDFFLAAPHQGELRLGNFADGCFPAAYGEIKAFFESLKDLALPDVIFCHERDDRHQDHRIINEMVWSTFRDQMILEYEIPKWDGGLGQPNVYVALDATTAERKADALWEAYASQRNRHWFSRDTFISMLRMRGLECRSPSGYAEAFHGRKLRIRAP